MPPKRKRAEDAAPAEASAEARTTRRSTRNQNKEAAVAPEGTSSSTTKAAEARPPSNRLVISVTGLTHISVTARRQTEENDHCQSSRRTQGNEEGGTEEDHEEGRKIGSNAPTGTTTPPPPSRQQVFGEGQEEGKDGKFRGERCCRIKGSKPPPVPPPPTPSTPAGDYPRSPDTPVSASSELKSEPKTEKVHGKAEVRPMMVMAYT
ncbi:hypothetical protein NMY22_g11620 [Coprinellus aureogranulatus]|nr:hypothetical protein NMY22_g11620 [Coprinellus aureogranulatus]